MAARPDAARQPCSCAPALDGATVALAQLPTRLIELSLPSHWSPRRRVCFFKASPAGLACNEVTARREGNCNIRIAFVTHLVTSFVSRDIDLVSERLTSISGASTSVDYFGNPDLFSMSLTAARLGCLILSKVRVTGWSLTRPMEGLTNISIPIAGAPLKFRTGARTYEITADDPAAVGRPFETLQAKLQEGAAIVLHAPISALSDRAEQLTAGFPSGWSVSQMVDRVDLRAPAGEALVRTLKTVIAEISVLNSVGFGSLAVSGYEDLLTNLAAAALFPPIVESLRQQSDNCSPAAIRRARDFIKEHAAEPIEISKLAADLGLPMRTLQQNFRRFFGLSPRAFLSECRLEKAHQRLTLPDPPTSVSAVAYECGFADLSDFSAKYRKMFGELPSQTLRAARRHFS